MPAQTTMRLVGDDAFRRRLQAVKKVIPKVGRKWGQETVQAARPLTPVRTGKLRKSFRIRSSQKRAIVLASFVAYFVDAGPVAHPITPRKSGGLYFTARGRTVFARKVNHPGYGARPFRHRAAVAGLENIDLATDIVNEWNAAG